MFALLVVEVVFGGCHFQQMNDLSVHLKMSYFEEHGVNSDCLNLIYFHCLDPSSSMWKKMLLSQHRLSLCAVRESELCSVRKAKMAKPVFSVVVSWMYLKMVF